MSEQEEILAEQEEDDTPIDVAPDRRRVKTDKQDLPVDTIQGWVARGKVNPQPDFQRYYVWNNKKASRLIESLLLDIPIPVVYVAEEPNKTYKEKKASLASEKKAFGTSSKALKLEQSDRQEALRPRMSGNESNSGLATAAQTAVDRSRIFNSRQITASLEVDTLVRQRR